MGSTATSDGASSPVLVDLDGDNRNELIVGGSDGFVHALPPRRHRAAGWPVRGDPLAAAHRRRGVHQRRGRRATSAERSSPRSRSPTSTTTASPEVYRRRPRGQGLRLERRRHAALQARGEPRLLRQAAAAVRRTSRQRRDATAPSTASSARRCSPTSTATAATSRSIAASMDRHVYAWHPNGTPVPGFPVLVVDRTKITSIDPQTHQVTFTAGSAPTSTRARSSTRPRSATSTRRRQAPRSSSARTRSTRPATTAASTRAR